jgi:hypothetical protein
MKTSWSSSIPKDLLDVNYPHNILSDTHMGSSHRIDQPKQMHAVLLSTHGVALIEKVAGKPFADLKSDDFPSALKVAAVFALQAYGLTGWFAKIRRVWGLGRHAAQPSMAK